MAIESTRVSDSIVAGGENSCSQMEGDEDRAVWLIRISTKLSAARQACSRAHRVPRGRRASTGKRRLLIGRMSYETPSSR